MFNQKKKWHTEQDTKNFVYKWLQKTFGSYRLAKLSARECNPGTRGEAWRPALRPALARQGDCRSPGQRLPVGCTLCLHQWSFQEPGLPMRQSRKGKTSGTFTVQYLANTLNLRKDCQSPWILLAMALTSPKLRVHLCLNESSRAKESPVSTGGWVTNTLSLEKSGCRTKSH